MSRELKPATVRFYFDADVLGVAKVVAGLRNDSKLCSRYPAPGSIALAVRL